MAKAPRPSRGEIWIVQFDPAVGSEIRKARPAVIMNVRGVGRLPANVVVPITDWKSEYAALSWFVFLPASPENGLSKNSGADTFQIKSLSHLRFVRRLGEVDDDQLDEIAAAIAVCVGYRP